VSLTQKYKGGTVKLDTTAKTPELLSSDLRRIRAYLDGLTTASLSTGLGPIIKIESPNIDFRGTESTPLKGRMFCGSYRLGAGFSTLLVRDNFDIDDLAILTKVGEAPVFSGTPSHYVLTLPTAHLILGANANDMTLLDAALTLKVTGGTPSVTIAATTGYINSSTDNHVDDLYGYGFKVIKNSGSPSWHETDSGITRTMLSGAGIGSSDVATNIDFSLWHCICGTGHIHLETYGER
jgi:hypothetical protein